MLLYHGTSLKNGEKILKSGILPRRSKRSNWDHCQAPSRSDCVYLTSVYAGYFAQQADKEGQGWAIFEIDSNQLNPGHLLPDEDCLALLQSSRGSKEFME